MYFKFKRKLIFDEIINTVLMRHVFTLLILFLIVSQSCNKEPQTGNMLRGTNSFIYKEFEPLKEKPVEVFYHIPNTVKSNSPILFAFHGNGRDAQNVRNLLIEKANQYNCILICPEFSDKDYPGGDSYNLGNIFTDGDNPSSSSLNNEDDWTFSIIEPLFDYVKNQTNNESDYYDIIGHSAGGQFAHRFMIFKPNARINKIACAASGWYTVLDNQISFPYGLENSPAEQLDLTKIFNQKVYIIVGEEDDDPNSAGLRHNNAADAQGLNRLDRANHFFTKAQNASTNLATSFNWEKHILPNVAHDYSANAKFSMDLFY